MCLYFNPHEREARDKHAVVFAAVGYWILIHTSVKLVTEAERRSPELPRNFNPHEREARD